MKKLLFLLLICSISAMAKLPCYEYEVKKKGYQEAEISCENDSIWITIYLDRKNGEFFHILYTENGNTINEASYTLDQEKGYKYVKGYSDNLTDIYLTEAEKIFKSFDDIPKEYTAKYLYEKWKKRLGLDSKSVKIKIVDSDAVED